MGVEEQIIHEDMGGIAKEREKPPESEKPSVEDDLKIYDRSAFDTGIYHAILVGDKDEGDKEGDKIRPHVEPLYKYNLLDSEDTKITNIEERMAQEVRADDPDAISKVEEQFDKSRIYGTVLKGLQEAFREVGKDKIWVIKQSDNSPGFDDYKLGHQINFGWDTMFVATREVADRIREKLTTGGVPMGGAEADAHLNPNYYWQFLDKDRGFILKFDGGHGQQSMVFLYGEAKKAEDPVDNNVSNIKDSQIDPAPEDKMQTAAQNLNSNF